MDPPLQDIQLAALAGRSDTLRTTQQPDREDLLPERFNSRGVASIRVSASDGPGKHAAIAHVNTIVWFHKTDI